MSADDYYKVLGVSRDASDDAIKRAYRKLARKYHPDVNTGADAAQMFQTVSEAYDVLRDPEKRAAYDQYGADWQNPRPQASWDGGFGFAPDDMGRAGAADFDDIFKAFGSGGFAQRAVQHVRLEVDLEDVFAGARKRVELRLPQLDQQGRVVWRTETLDIDIPKGLSEGQHLRLQADGTELIAEVAVKPHPIFRLDGRDISVDLPVTPWEAALGARVAMPTPSGKVEIRVPPNARSGQKLRLKGKGLPGAVAGDLFATLLIINPPVKSAEAKELYEKMAREFRFDPRRARE